MDYIYYGNVYSNEELQPYHKYFSDDVWTNSFGKTKLSSDKRDYIFLENYLDPYKIVNSYSRFLKKKNQMYADFFFLSLTEGFTCKAKIARYLVGDDFYWHIDGNYKIKQNKSWSRLITTVTYLNDNYEGGETEFINLTIKPETGKTLIFPSNWCFPHRGKPVTLGIKYILVNHFWI